MEFRTPYDGKSKRIQIDFSKDKGKTIQEQSAATDINNILARFNRTGIIDHVQKNEPYYGEFGEFDFHHNQNMITKITESFMELPAKTRREFDDDPANFAEFISQQKNVDDMKDGIIGNEEPEIPEKPSATKADETPKGEKKTD